MMEKSIQYILIALLCFLVGSCSEEDNATNNVIDIEVLDSNSSYGYIPRATHESVLVIVQDYGGTVYNEATDQEIYVETHYYEKCVKWQHYLGAFTNDCLAWAPATRAVYEIPLAVGENRIYMVSKDVAATMEPSIIIEHLSLNPAYEAEEKSCDDPALLHAPTLVAGHWSDASSCFLFEADIDKIYTILITSGSYIYIYDINSNLLAKGDNREWSDEFQRFVEVRLKAGQQIYIKIFSDSGFEFGLY